MPGAEMLERADQADGYDGHAELLRDSESAFPEFINMTVTRAFGLRENDRLVPESIASRVKRHMRFKSEGRRTSGTGTFPKRFMSQP